MLMSSTPLAYPQVVSRRSTSFRVANFSVSAAHGDFRRGFDPRQLRQRKLVKAKSLGQLSFSSTSHQHRSSELTPNIRDTSSRRLRHRRCGPAAHRMPVPLPGTSVFRRSSGSVSVTCAKGCGPGRSMKSSIECAARTQRTSFPVPLLAIYSREKAPMVPAKYGHAFRTSALGAHGVARSRVALRPCGPARGRNDGAHRLSDRPRWAMSVAAGPALAGGTHGLDVRIHLQQRIVGTYLEPARRLAKLPPLQLIRPAGYSPISGQ